MPNVPEKAENLYDKSFVRNERKVNPRVMRRKYDKLIKA